MNSPGAPIPNDDPPVSIFAQWPRNVSVSWHDSNWLDGGFCVSGIGCFFAILLSPAVHFRKYPERTGC